MSQHNIVLPRPGASINNPKSPIPAPSESSFTATFGTLLPAAKFLQTPHGKAAYYSLPPTSQHASIPPSRILFIHGVQTPALGMYPLAHALHTSFLSAHIALFDLWGHGLSSTPQLAHEPSLFLALIDAILDELAWPSAHLVGFSFGGALAVGYVASRTARVQTYTLIAPAGLVPLSVFDEAELVHVRGGGDEVAAEKFFLGWLEGGELIVPQGWQEQVAKGDVVAAAIREWQLREHRGHAASVVGIVRDGGVMGSDDVFVKAIETKVPNFAVLGELDDICTEEQLRKLGFEGVVVVNGAGHAVVREKVPEVAELIGGFWKANFGQPGGDISL
jgi:pimeloyl-ACP methyl ester carboxylesterase